MQTIYNSRHRNLNSHDERHGDIVYWMNRDHRVEDNWALLHAQQLADANNSRVRVVFCIRQTFAYATSRLVDFMMNGLEEVERDLHKYGVSFEVLVGDPIEEIQSYVKTHKIGVVVTDFSPLRTPRRWKNILSQNLTIPLIEVDAHNIVPAWIASTRQEYSAYTFRRKITPLVPTYLTQYPEFKKQHVHAIDHVDWHMVRNSISVDTTVAPVTHIKPGARQARATLEEFISSRISGYEMHHNDPVADAQSHMSAYLHMGHISAQRVAYEIMSRVPAGDARDAYLEQLIVRRELSDNYCLYNTDYDNPRGYPSWARATLDSQLKVARPYTYTYSQLRDGHTHDALWNAAQMQMVKTGRMHGYMRMYWAKKILEWTPDYDTAHVYARRLNDTYMLDGRDPNGYVGVAWSIGGVHDRPWTTRPIYGMIRYMNESGCRRKFDVDSYINKIQAL